MAELINIYTEDKKEIGTVLKKDYYSRDSRAHNPWIQCCTCFVINKNTGEILFERRGNGIMDPGKLDLCSGHVRHGEIPMQGMMRELKEELSIDYNYSSSLKQIGEVKLDYTDLPDEAQRKNLRCFVSVFALALDDISSIKQDNNEVDGFGWMTYGDAVKLIKFGMTRVPYNDRTSKQFLKVFQSLEEYIRKIGNKSEKSITEK